MRTLKPIENTREDGGPSAGPNGLITMDPAADAGERTAFVYITRDKRGKIQVIDYGHGVMIEEKLHYGNISSSVKTAAAPPDPILSPGSGPTEPT
jgi:hypothetical protein